MRTGIQSIGLGERYSPALGFWVHATWEAAGGTVQIYARGALEQPHRELVAKGTTLEALLRVLRRYRPSDLFSLVSLGLLEELEKRVADARARE